MTDAWRDVPNVATYYTLGMEKDRLENGAGALEFLRTQALLKRYLPAPPAIVADVGGGPGRYAMWLLRRGYHVHLIDPVALHVEQARMASKAETGTSFESTLGDARDIPMPDASADAVLLMGPLYHLPDRGERVLALVEARRVCKPGGVVLAAAISRFASTLDGLRGGFLENPEFSAIAAADRQDGQHRNPTNNPSYFTTAYFHRPEDLAVECAEAGLVHQITLAIEGPAWLLPDLDERFADSQRRDTLLAAIAAIEAEPTLLGVSAHLLAVARRQTR